MFIYKNEFAVPHDLCDTFIDEFENSSDRRPGVLYDDNGQSSDRGKKSTDISFNPSFLNHEKWGTPLKNFINILESNFTSYISRYNKGLSSIDSLQVSSIFNMQRYLPNEGFFNYHCERGTTADVFLKRELVWMVYLNDVHNGGETEFYYQQIFERPRKGTLLIWPADWTHLHRGIPSPTETKYILTGWFERENELKIIS